MNHCSYDYATGFRIIIVIEANSYVNTRSSRLLSKFKIQKINSWCAAYSNDYISLTDIEKYKNTDDPRFVIQNWMRNRNTLEWDYGKF